MVELLVRRTAETRTARMRKVETLERELDLVRMVGMRMVETRKVDSKAAKTAAL